MASRPTGSPAPARSMRSTAARDYYEQLIIINMERAKRLPAPEEQPKYAVVDAGDARLSLWENGRKVDEMKVIVGKAETATPMMAAYIKYAEREPLLERPAGAGEEPDRPARRRPGRQLPDRPRISGDDRLWRECADSSIRTTSTGRRWSTDAQEVRLRRLPSPANSMGMMKFMLPNYFGIYLHDSPEKDHFTKNELWISNGCVRVEDYKRFARWLFGGVVPQGQEPQGRGTSRSCPSRCRST